MKTKKPHAPIPVNAEEMNREYPDRFWIPESRDKLRVGDIAKVCANGERFWVEITSVENGVYTGKVGNALIDPDNRKLKYGSLMQFAPCNVYQAIRGDEFLD